VVATTVNEGAFREDLYYRLNVFPIMAPAPRERKEDIPELLRHILERTSQEYGLTGKKTI
jgi:DNA-binding NtrC family response regulator